MAKTASAHTGPAVRVGNNVEHDIVRAGAVTRHPTHASKVVESKTVSHSPVDVMIGARRVAAHADRTNKDPAGGVEGKAVAKHVDAANFAPNHGVIHSGRCPPLARCPPRSEGPCGPISDRFEHLPPVSRKWRCRRCTGLPRNASGWVVSQADRSAKLGCWLMSFAAPSANPADCRVNSMP